MKSASTVRIFVISTILMFIIDQATKAIISHLIPENSFVEISSFFYVTNIKNPGICFGFLSNTNCFPFLVVTSLFAVVFILYLVLRHPARLSSYACLCLGLIEGGILGNLSDRLRFLSVVDFIDFHNIWPVFNFADTGIVCGVICLIFLTLWRKNAPRVS